MSDRDNGASFSCGLLVGVALGAMAALLFAPRSGAELRSELEESRRRLRETKAKTGAELRESGREVYEAYDKARGALTDAAEEVKRAARNVVTSLASGSRGNEPPAIEE